MHNADVNSLRFVCYEAPDNFRAFLSISRVAHLLDGVREQSKDKKYLSLPPDRHSKTTGQTTRPTM
jgi:hypothetical protein